MHNSPRRAPFLPSRRRVRPRSSARARRDDSRTSDSRARSRSRRRSPSRPRAVSRNDVRACRRGVFSRRARRPDQLGLRVKAHRAQRRDARVPVVNHVTLGCCDVGPSCGCLRGILPDDYYVDSVPYYDRLVKDLDLAIRREHFAKMNKVMQQPRREWWLRPSTPLTPVSYTHLTLPTKA